MLMGWISQMLEFDKVSKFLIKKSQTSKKKSYSNDVYSFDCENESYIYKNLKNHSRSKLGDITEFLYSHGLCPEPWIQPILLNHKKIDGSELTVSEFESWSWIESHRVLHKHFEAGISRLRMKFMSCIEKLKPQPLQGCHCRPQGEDIFAELYSHLTLYHLDLNPKNILRKMVPTSSLILN